MKKSDLIEDSSVKLSEMFVGSVYAISSILVCNYYLFMRKDNKLYSFCADLDDNFENLLLVDEDFRVLEFTITPDGVVDEDNKVNTFDKDITDVTLLDFYCDVLSSGNEYIGTIDVDSIDDFVALGK